LKATDERDSGSVPNARRALWNGLSGSTQTASFAEAMHSINAAQDGLSGFRE
jgi:hypothetical protein